MLFYGWYRELSYLCGYGEDTLPTVSYWACCSVGRSTLNGALRSMMGEQGLATGIHVELAGGEIFQHPSTVLLRPCSIILECWYYSRFL